MRRTVIIIIIVVLLAAAGLFFWNQQRQATAEPEFEILREAEVQVDRITATVNATGSIEPEALVTLTFGLAGPIQDVNVVRGQTVAEGDVLATLDTAELVLSVQQAQDALRIQELTLQQNLNAEPTNATLASAQADIDAAEANLAVAQANLAQSQAAVLQAQAQKAQLLDSSSAATIAQAEATLAQAQAQQKQAQITYDRVLQCFDFEIEGREQEICPGLGATEEQARFNLNQANQALAAAEAQVIEAKAGPRPSDIQAADAAIASAQAGVQAAEGSVAAAEANLARAQAAYDRLLESPSEDQIAVLEAQVDSAGTNLKLAELRLNQAIITAPFAGQIANVLINEGEQASPGSPAISLVDEGAFHITVNVDEIDIDRLEVGQPVDITLDALPDVPVSGEVAEIAPTSANVSGVVTYIVTINIVDAPEEALRAGMSANASIVVDEVDGVLVVPNWAVRLDRETGEAYANVRLADGTIEEVPVETGLRNEQLSEVLSGLQAGDVVVVTNEREGLAGFFGN